MSVSIKSYSAKDSAKLTKHAKLIEATLGLIGEKRFALFTGAGHMQIRHGVFFENNTITNWFIAREISPQSHEDRWYYTPRGLDMQEWLNGNIPGKYSIQTNSVFFEDYDDALLCYLRFKG